VNEGNALRQKFTLRAELAEHTKLTKDSVLSVSSVADFSNFEFLPLLVFGRGCFVTLLFDF